MEHLALWIYLFGVVDDIRNASAIGASFTGGLLFIAWIVLTIILDVYPEIEGKPMPESIKILILSMKKKTGWAALMIIIAINIFSISQTLIPSSKTIAAMIIIPKIAQNKDMQKLPANVAKTLNEAVVSWGKQLSKGGE